jgi:hypothetical protein
MGRAHQRATAFATVALGLLVLRAAVGCALVTGLDQLVTTDCPCDASAPADAPVRDSGAAEGLAFDGTPPPTPEASRDAPDAFDVTGDDSSPPDAPLCPGCVCATLADTLDPDASPSNWSLVGAARLRGGYAQLTPDMTSSAGALWWTTAAPMLLTSFDVSFQISLTFAPSTGMGPADGLAFAWIGTATAPTVCGGGSNICVLGQSLPGNAVIVRTDHHFSTEPPAPYVAIVDTSASPLAPAPGAFTSIAMSGIPTQLPMVNDNAAPPDATWHLVRVRSAHGSVDVWLDGTPALTQVPLPSSAATTGYWGFGAATGSNAERHAVRNITMTLLDPACP